MKKGIKPIYDRPLIIDAIENIQNHILIANQELAHLKRAMTYKTPSSYFFVGSHRSKKRYGRITAISPNRHLKNNTKNTPSV